MDKILRVTRNELNKSGHHFTAILIKTEGGREGGSEDKL